MRERLLAICLCLLLAAGCASRTEDAPQTTAAPAAEEPSAEVQTAAQPEEGPENLFEIMPSSFMFCSGTGGWSTELTIEEDGTFTGLFHDADMGVADPEKFPRGTWYICNFNGKFTQPEQVNDYTYSMELEALELAHPADGTEEYADNVRYIYSGPYGLEEAEELLIYLPDAPAAELPEWAIRAAMGPYDWQETAEGTLGLYVIYNVNEELGFAEYPRVTKE